MRKTGDSRYTLGCGARTDSGMMWHSRSPPDQHTHILEEDPLDNIRISTERGATLKTPAIWATMLALAAGLAMLSPTPAAGQNTRLIFADDHGIFVPATDQQIVRVTIGNPQLPEPAGDRQLQSFLVVFDRPIDPVTIGPGESFTYTIDPRAVGLAPSRPGLRQVRVGFRFKVEVVEGQSDPRPALTIEVLNRRTGAVESVHAFPGFAGGVRVASGDL